MKIFRRKKFESDMDAELRFHVAAYTDDLMRSGLDRQEAERRARIAFGTIEGAKDECRQAWGLERMDEIRADLRLTFRGLRKNPGFAAIAIVSLALGIGANTAIVGVVDAVMLRLLPVREPGRLVFVETAGTAGRDGPPYPYFELVRDQAKSFEKVAAFSASNMEIGIDGGREQVSGVWVSGNFYEHSRIHAAKRKRQGCPLRRGFARILRNSGRAAAVGTRIHGARRRRRVEGSVVQRDRRPILFRRRESHREKGEVRQLRKSRPGVRNYRRGEGRQARQPSRAAEPFHLSSDPAVGGPHQSAGAGGALDRRRREAGGAGAAGSAEGTLHAFDQQCFHDGETDRAVAEQGTAPILLRFQVGDFASRTFRPEGPEAVWFAIVARFVSRGYCVSYDPRQAPFHS